jgi:hypothetical protein
VLGIPCGEGPSGPFAAFSTVIARLSDVDLPAPSVAESLKVRTSSSRTLGDLNEADKDVEFSIETIGPETCAHKIETPFSVPETVPVKVTMSLSSDDLSSPASATKFGRAGVDVSSLSPPHAARRALSATVDVIKILIRTVASPIVYPETSH